MKSGRFAAVRTLGMLDETGQDVTKTLISALRGD